MYAGGLGAGWRPVVLGSPPALCRDMFPLTKDPSIPSNHTFPQYSLALVPPATLPISPLPGPGEMEAWDAEGDRQEEAWKNSLRERFCVEQLVLSSQFPLLTNPQD